MVVTATKSGYEYQFARFGDYLSAALLDESSDLDRDGQSSVLELFLTAARGVADFYEQESRLATEHGLLDDNGDGLGTPPDWFRGVRATRRAAEDAPLDGLRAHQIHLVRSDFERSVPAERRPVRDALERKIADLREQKPSLDQDEYYERLQSLLVELARWYEAEEQRAADRSSEPPRNSATAPADD